MADAESSTAQFIFYRPPGFGVSGFDLRLTPAYLDSLVGRETLIANIHKPLGAHLQASALGANLDKIPRPQLERIEDALGNDHLPTLTDPAHRCQIDCVSAGHTFSLAEMRKLSRASFSAARGCMVNPAP